MWRKPVLTHVISDKTLMVSVNSVKTKRQFLINLIICKDKEKVDNGWNFFYRIHVPRSWTDVETSREHEENASFRLRSLLSKLRLKTHFLTFHGVSQTARHTAIKCPVNKQHSSKQL